MLVVRTNCYIFILPKEIPVIIFIWELVFHCKGGKTTCELGQRLAGICKFNYVVSGLIWSEIKQLWDVGLEEYVRDMWNVIDFITNSLYVATVALRIVSIYQVIPHKIYIFCRRNIKNMFH